MPSGRVCLVQRRTLPGQGTGKECAGFQRYRSHGNCRDCRGQGGIRREDIPEKHVCEGGSLYWRGPQRGNEGADGSWIRRPGGRDFFSGLGHGQEYDQVPGHPEGHHNQDHADGSERQCSWERRAAYSSGLRIWRWPGAKLPLSVGSGVGAVGRSENGWLRGYEYHGHLHAERFGGRRGGDGGRDAEGPYGGTGRSVCPLPEYRRSPKRAGADGAAKTIYRRLQPRVSGKSRGE